MKIQVEDSGGYSRQVEGEFIEPIQLQVVCQRWWKEITEGKDIKSKVNVDSALQDFYVDAVREAIKDTGVREEYLRKWCEKAITPNGTRSIVHRRS